MKFQSFCKREIVYFAENLSCRWGSEVLKLMLLFGVQEADQIIWVLRQGLKSSKAFPKQNVCTLYRTCHAGGERGFKVVVVWCSGTSMSRLSGG